MNVTRVTQVSPSSLLISDEKLVYHAQPARNASSSLTPLRLHDTISGVGQRNAQFSPVSSHLTGRLDCSISLVNLHGTASIQVLHVLILCLSCHSTSPRMLSSMSSVVSFGFHPKPRARLALHREFEPYHTRSYKTQIAKLSVSTPTLGRRAYMFVPRSCIILLVKRRRCPLVGAIHAELGEGLADPFSHCSCHIFSICAKIQTLQTTACTPIEDPVV